MNTLLVREATPQQINAALLALSNSLGKSTEEVQQILATTSKIIELTKAEYEPIQQAGKWEKDAIYLVTDQSITGVVVDQHYSATSSNAQSGTAVAEAIADRVTQSQLSGALTNLATTYQNGNVIKIGNVIIQNKVVTISGGNYQYIPFDVPFTDVNTVSVSAFQSDPLVIQNGTIYIDGITDITTQGFKYFANTNGLRNVRFIAMGR